MAPEPERTPRSAAAAATLSAVLAAALALAMGSGIPGLGDGDPYRHLAYAKLLWQSHLALRGHPFLPFTALARTPVDFWWGFHLLLGPFTPLGTIWGARLAGACIAAGVAASLCLLVRRLGGPTTWLVGIAPLVLSFSYAYRDHLARPAHLTVPLLLVQLACGAGVVRARWAAAAAAAHGWLHLSAPLSPAFAALGWIGHFLGRDRAGPRPPLTPVLASVAGLLVGWLARPGGSSYWRLALGQVLGDFGGAPGSGWELLPAPPSLLLEQAGPCLGLLVLAALWGRGRPRFGTPTTRVASLLAVLAAAVMTVGAFRFIDYLVPFAVVSSALLWPRDRALPPRGRPFILAGVSLLAAAAVARNLFLGWGLGSALFDPPPTLAEVARMVRAQVPAGSLLFTTDPFATDLLVAELPEYAWPVAYDHALLHIADRERFWAWHHLSREGVDCRAADCPAGAPRGAEAAERVLGLFGSRWLLTRGHGDAALENALAGTSGGPLVPVAQVRAPVSGHWTLWRLEEAQRR